MAGVKFLKGAEEWQLFMDYWNLCQKYWEPEENDKYWEELVDAADKFYRKYNTSFARSLAADFISEVERKRHYIQQVEIDYACHTGIIAFWKYISHRNRIGMYGEASGRGLPERRGNGLSDKGTAYRMAAAGEDKYTDSGNDRTER